MVRIAAIVGLSIAVGAAAAYLYLRGSAPSYIVVEPSAALDARAGAAAPRAESLESVLDRESAVSTRATIYGMAAQADERALAALLQDAADLEDSASRELLLGALTLRAAELGADAALDTVRTLPLDGQQASELGLLLVGELGPSTQTIEGVITALPQIERRRFRLDALARWADRDPERAYQEALSIGDRQLKAVAVDRVAYVWAERDLPSALAEAALLSDDNVGRAFRQAVVRRLGATDPAAMVAYVNGVPKYESALMSVVIGQLRLMEPTEALGWAEQLNGRLGEEARRSALVTWAQEDPLGAFAYSQALPLGEERQSLMYAIANGYGRDDPDAALAWVATQKGPPQDLRASVIAGIAQVDARRALDLAFREEPNVPSFGGWSFRRGRFDMLSSVITNAMASSAITAPELVARVLALRDDNERNNALQQALGYWTRSDPRAAFDWLVTERNLPRQNLSVLVNSMVRTDPVLAASYTDRVPDELRGFWIASVAQNYSRLDPEAAMHWLGGFRNEKGYVDGVVALVHQTVNYDPAKAAGLVDSLDDKGQNTLSAAEAVGRAWGGADEQAARLWMRGLAEGPLRDAALRGFIFGVYGDSMPDASLLGQFSSQQARQQTVLQIIYAIGREDRDEARRLADEHISLPELRSQFQSWLERSNERGLTVFPGGVVLRN
jgi:hypothetical protein